MSDAIQRDSGLVTGSELARTYAHPAYADPWDAVEDFRAVQAYAERHPGAGSTAVAKRFDLPRSRVRPWLEGSRPDCVRGLQTAEAHGWVDVAPDGDVFRGLNVMLAWVFSGGSILNETWVPYFVSGGETDRRLLDRAAALVGVELDFTRSGASGRARELRPLEDASVLGRVLTVLGAPRGEKDGASGISLPGYLKATPDRIGQEFVQVYLGNRGRVQDSGAVHVREDRPEAYLRSVASLIRRLTGEAVSVAEQNVILSAAAGRAIRGWPPVFDVDGS